ncbi:MAG: hypothetical protein IKV80_10465 [Bacteroidales bacterium]|nr:hypothetical protein [Bacteroidales bacterium]
MKKHRLYLIILLFTLLSGKITAQSMDPTLAAMVLLYTEKAEKTLEAQKNAMLLETTGHIWIEEEVDNTYKLHKEFNEYLDSFRGIIVYAAQIYGFYHEIQKLTENLQGLSTQITNSPSNAVAVALSTNRNKMYREIILQSVEIVNDVRTLCLSDIKMTEKERIEAVFGIRPKLKVMNQKLIRLTRAVKYTSMNDVWNEITDRQPAKADINNISKSAFQRWKSIGKNVRP